MQTTPATALRTFRAAYESMLVAAEKLRICLEAEAGEVSDTPEPLRCVQQVVAEYFGLPVELFVHRRRDQPTALARMIAMHLCRQHTAFSLVAIGRAFARDHNTVMHATKAVQDMAETDEKTAHDLAVIEPRVRAALLAMVVRRAATPKRPGS